MIEIGYLAVKKSNSNIFQENFLLFQYIKYNLLLVKNLAETEIISETKSLLTH